MLDPPDYRKAKHFLESSVDDPREAYEYLKGYRPPIARMHRYIAQHGEREAFILFSRTLYRFYTKRPDLRDAYLAEIARVEPLTGLPLVVLACDRIESGQIESAFDILETQARRGAVRWRKSAMFQIVRIGFLDKTYQGRAAPYARELRDLLEVEFESVLNNDLGVKYSLCSMFLNYHYLCLMEGVTDSDLIARAQAELGDALGEALGNETYWDAC